MKTTPRYHLRLTPEKTLELMTEIASGLLAGGHLNEDLVDISNDILRRIQNKVENSLNDPRLQALFILPREFDLELSNYKEWMNLQEKKSKPATEKV